MSLLQQLQYNDYKKAKAFTLEQCVTIASLTKLEISFNNVDNPGEHLLEELHRNGFTKSNYEALLLSLQRYRPQAKIAILIANDKYIHLSKLATPSTDCDSLGSNLKLLGFIVVTIKNTTAHDLKVILRNISDVIPADSYCFMFYAGHGCQLCNTKCMLGIDCPTENVEVEHCVTENYALKVLEGCQLDMCILIMDMCRVPLDREANPSIYLSMTDVEDYMIHNNLLICYSTQSSKGAYEMVQMEFSTMNGNSTYQLQTGDSKRILSGMSVYVNALCTRFEDSTDISSLLDRVHADVERLLEKQRPIKLQCGTDKRYLYDATIGDTTTFLQTLKEATKSYKEHCIVY
ncbi:hypothetical protein O3G_MSEX012046 [Manduca sexta]|uniref:Caspase family p20 domain-containing protein n=1 Tax=Manduca sexta TaxID=7130 RepID=A0A921ZNK6_MANSE|nr:hypothetical protein O3G_MSEX012046 [Manduca sexta]